MSFVLLEFQNHVFDDVQAAPDTLLEGRSIQDRKDAALSGKSAPSRRARHVLVL